MQAEGDRYANFFGMRQSMTKHRRNSVWAIWLVLMVFVGGYSIAAFAGVLAEPPSQTDEEDTPPPEQTPPEPEATPAPDMTPPPEGAMEPGTSETEVEVQRLSSQEMQQYEQELDDLRTRIMKTKARLIQLREQLRLGSVSIISLAILHTHEVGGAFRLESLSYTLDGFEVYAGVNTPESNLEELEDFPIYEGSLLPGEHLLAVDMVFRGRGYGIFSYLNQYLFKVKARYLFTVNEGDAITLKVVSFDEGSFLTSLRNRLKVKFEQE